MVCPTCNKPTSRLIIDKLGSACATCRGQSEAGGTSATGLLTRNSDRVREQQRQFEGDTILPHAYDKASRKVKPNDDFIKMYPDKVGNFFKQSELEQAGYTKIGDVYKQKAAEKSAAEQSKATFKKGTPKGL